MTPISGLRIHFDASWELMGDDDTQNADVTRTYRRLWKTKVIHGGNTVSKSANPALLQPSEVEEYIYLLIDAETLAAADSMTSILQAHIEDNIEAGRRPDDVDFQCPNGNCSYIIRLQGVSPRRQ